MLGRLSSFGFLAGGGPVICRSPKEYKAACCREGDGMYVRFGLDTVSHPGSGQEHLLSQQAQGEPSTHAIEWQALQRTSGRSVLCSSR